MINLNSRLVAGSIEVRSSVNKDDQFVTLSGSFPYEQKIDFGSSSEVVQSGAFKQSTVGDNDVTDIRLLSEHDPRKPLASTGNKTLTLEETKAELRFEAQVYTGTSWAADMLGGIRTGLITGVSPGFIVNHATRDADGLRRIVRARLIELSVVAQPAYPDARVAARSAARMPRAFRWIPR